MGLNKSKGNMYGFVTHTKNYVKGRCPVDCQYCHPAGTKILMSDYTHKNIEDVCEGDTVIGVKKNLGVGFYRFTTSKVLRTSKRIAKTIKLSTNDGEVICTPEHPLMGSTELRNGTDWKAARAFSPYENLRHVTTLSRGAYSKEHKLGYLKGVRDGDGCVFRFKNKEGKYYKGFEIVCVDEGLRTKIKNDFLNVLGIPLREGVKRGSKNGWGVDCIMLHTRISKDVEMLEANTCFRLNASFARGYIAGMLDTDGSVGKGGIIRISQSETVNAVKFENILKCCDLLNIDYVKEPNGIRIRSTFKTKLRILFEFGVFHSEKSKRLLIGNTLKACQHSQIQKIEVGKQVDTVYNLQTECESFVANGFVVHNCYMKHWGELKKPRLDESELNEDMGEGKFIFVGSSIDMWHDEINPGWLDRVMRHLQEYPHNTYLLQSKVPANFIKWIDTFPELFWSLDIMFATTIESNIDHKISKGHSPYVRAEAMRHLANRGYKTMVTVEPVLRFDVGRFVELLEYTKATKYTLGADSKGHKLPEPSAEDIYLLTDKISFHQKANLKRLLT